MVNQLDLKRLEEKIQAVEGRAGQSSLDPRLLMSLWIYGYSEGISSARELSRMCGYEPGCQWLTGMQTVNYHTLADFRVEHREELDRIFVQVLGLLSAEGLIEMKRITQDGTKIKAHAASQKFPARPPHSRALADGAQACGGDEQARDGGFNSAGDRGAKAGRSRKAATARRSAPGIGTVAEQSGRIGSRQSASVKPILKHG